MVREKGLEPSRPEALAPKILDSVASPLLTCESVRI